jgi:hypothetical protein
VSADDLIADASRHATSTLYDGEGKAVLQWVKKGKPEVTADSIREALATWDIARCPPAVAPAFVQEDLLNVIPLGDPHMGMRAWAGETGANFDLGIAERGFLDAVGTLLSLVPPAAEGVLALMGDTLHADDTKNKTPKSGHALDVDTRQHKVVGATVNVVRTSVRMMLERHQKVRVIVVRGNHDPSVSLLLKMALRIAFENEPRVVIDDDAAWFHYHIWGVNRLGFHHGHGRKMAELPLYMATDPAAQWDSAARLMGWWYTGHVHHEKRLEKDGIVAESINTIAARDAYAAEYGYRSRRCAFVDTLHRHRGRLSRFHWDLDYQGAP